MFQECAIREPSAECAINYTSLIPNMRGDLIPRMPYLGNTATFLTFDYVMSTSNGQHMVNFQPLTHVLALASNNPRKSNSFVYKHRIEKSPFQSGEMQTLANILVGTRIYGKFRKNKYLRKNVFFERNFILMFPLFDEKILLIGAF